jgi:hypothetical protein
MKVWFPDKLQLVIICIGLALFLGAWNGQLAAILVAIATIIAVILVQTRKRQPEYSEKTESTQPETDTEDIRTQQLVKWAENTYARSCNHCGAPARQAAKVCSECGKVIC